LSLAYDVGNVGLSKLAGIDVYFTHDGGQWEHYPDLVRPTGTVPMTVAKDGRYGFTLIARSNAGLAKQPPKAADQPQLWVEGDTFGPEAKLHPRQVVGGERELGWVTADRNLADRPVTLEGAPAASGPWTLIKSGLGRVGPYYWAPGEGVPAKVYLRLTACDA